MQRVTRIFLTVNGACVIAGLAAMAVIVGWNVGLRYLTNQSLPWADEVARYLMIWTTFLGAGLALRQGAHVAITNLPDALPPRGRIALRALVVGLMMAFFCFMIWIGMDYMGRSQFQKSAALRMPMKWVYAAMPAGFALLALHLALIARPLVLGLPLPRDVVPHRGDGHD